VALVLVGSNYLLFGSADCFNGSFFYLPKENEPAVVEFAGTNHSLPLLVIIDYKI
jgi:hypothetical protein